MKTRTLRHRDGRCELVRVLTAEDLCTWNDDDPLAYEKSIVWLEDIAKLRYVRVVEVRCAKSRRGPLSINSGQSVVGYAKLLPDAPRDSQTQRFARRLFYLTEDDRRRNATVMPTSAVDPQTILPGMPGEKPQPIG